MFGRQRQRTWLVYRAHVLRSNPHSIWLTLSTEIQRSCLLAHWPFVGEEAHETVKYQRARDRSVDVTERWLVASETVHARHTHTSRHGPRSDGTDRALFCHAAHTHTPVAVDVVTSAHTRRLLCRTGVGGWQEMEGGFPFLRVRAAVKQQR